MFNKIFPINFFPKTIFRKIQGVYYTDDYKRVNCDQKSFYNTIISSGCKKIIAKPTIDTSSGRGIHIFELDNTEYYEHYTGEKLNIEYMKKNYNNDWIVQDVVEQSSYIQQFNKMSVNTIRLTLYRSVSDNQLHITSGIIRIGGKDSIVDNAHQGGGFIGINMSGHLNKNVCDQYGRTFNTFNGIDFSKGEFIIPNWNNIIMFAKSVGNYIFHHRLIALDIVLNENNTPMLLEINLSGYSPWLFQFTSGPALGNYADEIMNYCREIVKNKISIK